MQKDKENKKNSVEKNWLEWTVFGVSVLLVLAIIGYLTYQVYIDNPSSPDLYVKAVKDPSDLSPYRYHVTVENKGGTTAEEVIIEIALQKGEVSIEKAELQIPFTPHKSKREAWVTFSKDPALADTLTTRVVSYKKP